MKRIASIGLMALVSLPIAAQDFMYPRAGQCPATHMKFQGVCISSKLLEEQATEAVVRNLMDFKDNNNPAPGSRGPLKACLTKVDEDKEDILKLENGAIVEVSRGYLGYIGYRKDALLFKGGGKWKIWIEGKKVFPVEVYREPKHCNVPSDYSIEAALGDQTFIINGEKFEAQTFCLGWSDGESVIFLDGSEYGVCSSASIFNVDRAESCEMWCE